MTAANASWVWDVIYAPFGGVGYIWSNPATMNMRFPGQWFQLESGLAYNWYRHYDATLGRYVQPDPIGFAGGTNLYGYAGGNPLANVDLSGESFWGFFRPLLRLPGLFRGPGVPPPADPLPPGWTPDWMWRFPDTNGCPRWFDPRGGEWRLHRPDRWHPEEHWDHNPWDAWNSPWRNLDLDGKPLSLTPEQFEQCRIAGMCT
jgi:RHS repeat-associated protein